MIISFEQESCSDGGEPYKRKFTLETSDDLDIYQMLEEFKIILYAMTYHPKSVEEAFKEIDDS